MKLVYVAGPYRGKNAWVIENNIRRAEALALQVWDLGAACICPHTNTRFYQGVGPDDRWLKGDLEILSRCDAILMTPDWYKSIGAVDERSFAKAKNIPVFETLEALEKWLLKKSW